MNKKKKYTLISAAILIILLLVAGVVLLKGCKDTAKTNSTSTEKAGVFTVKKEKDATEESGDSGKFSNKTTNKKQSTEAGKKGASAILGIIPPDNNTPNDADAEKEEITWLPGIW